MRDMPQIPAAYAHYSNMRSIARLHKKEDSSIALGILFAGLIFVAAILLFY